MQTVTHCRVYASASTGGPSSAGSSAHPSASTDAVRPSSQSPEITHTASPATRTRRFIGPPAPKTVGCSWCDFLGDHDLHHEETGAHAEPRETVHPGAN